MRILKIILNNIFSLLKVPFTGATKAFLDVMMRVMLFLMLIIQLDKGNTEALDGWAIPIAIIGMIWAITPMVSILIWYMEEFERKKFNRKTLKEEKENE